MRKGEKADGRLASFRAESRLSEASGKMTSSLDVAWTTDKDANKPQPQLFARLCLLMTMHQATLEFVIIVGTKDTQSYLQTKAQMGAIPE